SNFLRRFDCLFHRGDHGAGSLRDVEFLQQLAEALTVFGQVDAFGRGPDDVDACGFERQRKIQRRLTAKLYDYADRRASGSFVFADGKHILERKRLEVEAVAGVVVGRDRLRIAVDHDGFVAILAQRVAGVAAAVIKFNSLPDAIGTGTENHNLLLRRGRGFVFFFVRGVEIRRVAFELRGAGIDALVDRLQAVLLAEVANLFLAAFAVQTPGSGEPSIGEAHALGFAQQVGGNRFHWMLLQLQLHVVNLFELVEEPGIDRGHLRDLLDRMPLANGVLHVGQALGMRSDQALCENFGLDFMRPHALARIERANSLLQGFFEGAADGHHFADGFHLRPKRFVGAGEFFELPLRNFYDDIVERGLEASWSLTRDVVGNLVERIADGKLGGNFRNRETRGLRRQRRRARDAWVHFDHHHASGRRIDAELNIRSSGFDADLADHGNRRIAHHLILAIGERLRRGDGDGVSGVHAHGIEVFNRADDDDVVFGVAHHLEFVLFPAEDGFFDQALMHGREIEAAGENLH